MADRLVQSQACANLGQQIYEFVVVERMRLMIPDEEHSPQTYNRISELSDLLANPSDLSRELATTTEVAGSYPEVSSTYIMVGDQQAITSS